MPNGRPPQRDAIARFRFSIIGPLLACPAPHGDLGAALRALAAKSWAHPVSGLAVRFAAPTLERWYYAARAAADPVAALRNRLRGDQGQFVCLTPRMIELLTAQYREHPGWTAQLHYDNLCVSLPQECVGPATAAPPSYPTVRRYLKARGMVRQKRPTRFTAGAIAARERLDHLEVRSFEMDHVAALWHLDFHHGSRKVLTRAGQWAKPYLLGVLDDRSRLCCHLQWYLDESAESLVHGLIQAFMKRGLPRALMSDNGAAMLAEETTQGLAALGIVHQTTLPMSPYQNAKQESFWARIEARLMAMLEGEANLTLVLLNQATQAWAEQEYHRERHSELRSSPLARFLAGPNVARPCPAGEVLANAFRIEEARRLRRSDGTVSLAGTRFEIPSRYHHLPTQHLRFARWDLTRVDLVDPRSGAILCPVRPLDKSANADGMRRRRDPPSELSPLPPASGIAPLLRQLISDYAATGLPPAYIPTDTDPESSP